MKTKSVRRLYQFSNFFSIFLTLHKNTFCVDRIREDFSVFQFDFHLRIQSSLKVISRSRFVKKIYEELG